MKRGLIVGNSHAAALKLAAAEDETMAYDTFAIEGGGGPSLRVENARIFAKNPKASIFTTVADAKERGVLVSDYDFAVFSAFGIAALRKQSPNPLVNIQLADLSPHLDRGPSVSYAIYRDCLRELLSKYDAFDAIHAIRRIFSGYILVQQAPIPASGVISQDDSPLTDQYGPRVSAFTKWLYASQKEIIGEFFGNMAGVVPVFVPEQWIEEGFTPREYATLDAWHMNGQYGKFVLRQVRDELARLPPR